MNSCDPIGLIDSGVGGFTVLKELQHRLPNENYIYFGDSKRMPYGERENEELISLGNAIIRELEGYGVKAIVLACNTLSSLINELSSTVPLFSVIEAGVQETLLLRERGMVGLIATTATVKNRGYEKELALLTRDLHYIAQETHTLAKVINDGKKDLDDLKHNIREAVEPILRRGLKEGVLVEELLLGCTHFPIVAGTIREIYPDLTLINPANGLMRQMQAYFKEREFFCDRENNGATTIFITAGREISERIIDQLDLNCDNLIETELSVFE
jgi:glutamate racemase